MWGRHTSTPVLTYGLLGCNSKHRATIYIYWISEVGLGGRHTSTPVLTYALWGFNSKHRATLYVYWISDAGSVSDTQAQLF